MPLRGRGRRLLLAASGCIPFSFSLLAAWRGGRADRLLGAAADMVLALSGLLLVLLVVAFAGACCCRS